MARNNPLIIPDLQASKAIKRLMKIYYNKNIKFSSELFDIFNPKLFIFYNTYIKLKLKRY